MTSPVRSARARGLLAAAPPAPVGAAVWLIDARQVGEAELAVLRGWLTAAERQRYQRFLRPQRQRQFLIGHGLLRLLLAQVLGQSPAAIELRERRGLAPQLLLPAVAQAQPAQPAQPGAHAAAPGFSLSHSGDWVACAVSAGTTLGLDIELRDAGRDLLALADQSFAAGDAAALRALAAPARVAEFYRLWSCKEATFKLDQGVALAPAPSCISLPHSALSIVLCSAAPLSAPPLLHTLDTMAHLIATANSTSPATGA